MMDGMWKAIKLSRHGTTLPYLCFDNVIASSDGLPLFIFLCFNMDY